MERTKDCDQRLDSFEELGGGNGIVARLINGDIGKGTLQARHYRAVRSGRSGHGGLRGRSISHGGEKSDAKITMRWNDSLQSDQDSWHRSGGVG